MDERIAFPKLLPRCAFAARERYALNECAFGG